MIRMNTWADRPPPNFRYFNDVVFNARYSFLTLLIVSVQCRDPATNWDSIAYLKLLLHVMLQ